jgi:hypothetical protein
MVICRLTNSLRRSRSAIGTADSRRSMKRCPSRKAKNNVKAMMPMPMKNENTLRAMAAAREAANSLTQRTPDSRNVLGSTLPEAIRSRAHCQIGAMSQ